MIVYITTQGSKIVKQGRHLIVRKGDDTYHTLFTHRLEQLVLCGNVTLTPSALKLLFANNIDVVFLQQNGRYIGRLALAESKNIFVRKMQFLLLTDDDFCLKAAKNILAGKLENMATVLYRIKRTRESKRAGQSAKAIKDLTDKIILANSIETLRGVEGSASAIYFKCFGLGLKGDWKFRKRVRRPPTDPVNAVLSLLYTFLINRVYASLRIAGLDPYCGVLHSLEYGRYSLALDLVEEFRAMIADTLTMSLFNLSVLGKKDFIKLAPSGRAAKRPGNDISLDKVCQDPIGLMNFDQAEGVFDLPGPQNPCDLSEKAQDKTKLPVQLKPEAFKKVVNAFEKKMSTEFLHPLPEKRMTYGNALVYQAKHYRKLVEGQISVYKPLILR